MTKSISQNHTPNAAINQYYKYVSFGKRLAEWRKAAGFTQESAASALSVSVSYISNLERDFSPTAKGGKPRPSLDFVDRAARVFRVPTAEMRVAAGYSPLEAGDALDEDDSRVMALFYKHNKLSREQKAAFRRIVDMVDRELDAIEQQEQSQNKLGQK